MKIKNEKLCGSMAAIISALSLLVLAACTHSGPPNPAANPASVTQADAAEARGSSADVPKVPYGNQPCRTFSMNEMRKLGFSATKPFEPGRDPDRLAFDNSCEFGDVTIVYTSRNDYQDQKDTLRSSRRTPPADLPNAFYDTLGSLWFAKKGYYVVIPNTVSEADKERVARAIAAKL